MSEIKKSRKVTYYIGMGMILLGFVLFISSFFSFGAKVNDFSTGFNNDSSFSTEFNYPSTGFNSGSSFSTEFSNPSTGFNNDSSFGSGFANAVLGMVFMIAGAVVMNIGAKGAAGSGLILDPEQSREDLKPFNEAKGGMINDVLSNIDVVDKFVNSGEKEVIKVRCSNCKALNDEDAKFCKGCGNTL